MHRKREPQKRSFAFTIIIAIALGELILQSPLLPYYLIFGKAPLPDLTTIHYLFLLFPLVGFFFLLIPLAIISIPFILLFVFFIN